MWQLAVDLGASRTVATLARDGGPAQGVQIDGSPAMPSGVYADPDGRLLVGIDAQRLADHDPRRYERYPVLRIPETNLLLGERVVPVVEAIAAVLGRIAGELRQRLGAEPNQVLLGTPAYWSALHIQALEQAATAIWGPGALQLVPGAHAAGAYCAAQSAIPLGYPFAVFDLGAGGLSCAVLVATPEGVRVLASAGAVGVGGVAADALLIEHLGRQVAGRDPAAWQAMMRPVDLADSRARFALQRSVQQAREQLSTLTQVTVDLPAPFSVVSLSRGELPPVLGRQLERAVGVLDAVLADARVAPAQLAGAFLLGGVARMPAVAERLGSRFRLLGRHEDAAVPLGAPLLARTPPPDVFRPAPVAAVLPVATWQPRTDGGAQPARIDDPGSSAAVKTQKRSSSKPAWTIAVVSAVVATLLVAGVAVAVVQSGSSEPETAAAPTTEFATQAPSRSRRAAPNPTAPDPTAPNPTAPTSVTPPPPVVTGWQTVAVPSRGAAYDVPPDWRVSSQSTIGGFEPKSGAPVVGKGYATFGQKFCDPYDAKATAVMTNSKQSDLAAGARELATSWATVAFADNTTGSVPALQVGEPRPVQTLAGTGAVLVEVSATVAKKQDCSVPVASMYALALPSTGGIVGLMIYAARGVPDEVSPAAIAQIMGSVRPL